ncbi:MAG: hypothetical protein RIC36_11565 [Rhodospirillales bacterium]
MSKKTQDSQTSGKSGKPATPMTEEAAKRIKDAAKRNPNSDSGFVKRAVDAAKENQK